MRNAPPALVLSLLFASCTSDESIGTVRELPLAQASKLDVLFVMDRSDSMLGKRQLLARNLPGFMTQLEQLPGGVPDVHVGVITSDLGAGPYELDGCRIGGDRAELQNAATVSGCAPPDGAFLSDEIGPDGQRVRNYQGSLADAFTCVASFAGNGCGFEQPLLALRKALDGTVAKNAGFLRHEAFLVVVVLTDEDDCSASDPRVFDPSRESETTLGPYASFRCTRYGVQCGGQLIDHAGSYSDCAPLADSYLTHPDEIVSFLATIKEPTTTFVALLSGDPTPVSVSSGEFGLKLEPSCRLDNVGSNPGVRLGYFADQLPNHSFKSLCSQDLTTALEGVGGRVREMIVAYTSDPRDDLHISYGCGVGGGGTGGLVWLLPAFCLIRRRRG